MSTNLYVSSDTLSDNTIHELSLEILETLRRETDVDPLLPEHEAQSGMRGDPITVGTIILTVLTSGTAVAMFKVLRSYFERVPSLKLEFKRANGETLTIRAENVSPEQINKTISLAREFFGVTS